MTPLFPTQVHALLARCEEAPDALAISVDGEGLTFADLRQGAASFAAGLSDRGVRFGQTCAFALPTSADLVIGIYGTQLAGAVPLIVSPTLPLATILSRVRAANAKILVMCEGRLEEFGALVDTDEAPLEIVEPASLLASGNADAQLAPPSTAPDDVAYLQSTSGTTGNVKLAVLLHKNLMHNLEAMRRRHAIVPKDVFVSWVPLYHDMGLVRFLFQPIYSGCPVHLLPASTASFPQWLETIERVGGTLSAAPDFSLRMTMRLVPSGKFDLSSLRLLINGAEPVKRDTIERFESHFGIADVVKPGYGLGEATLCVSGIAPGEPLRFDKTGNVSCGKSIGVEIEIRNEAGVAQPPGETGGIWVAGKSVFPGYFGDLVSSRAVLVDGWLDTGDIGYLDSDQHLFVLGRKRTLIKRAGAMVCPREVEEAVDKIDGIRFSVAVGFEREALGGSEDLVVVAEVRESELAVEPYVELARRIVEQVRQTLGHIPGDVVLVKPHTIPRTTNGKLQHLELRRRYGCGELERSGNVLHGGDLVSREMALSSKPARRRQQPSRPRD